jgi:hypothetical protein
MCCSFVGSTFKAFFAKIVLKSIDLAALECCSGINSCLSCNSANHTAFQLYQCSSKAKPRNKQSK